MKYIYYVSFVYLDSKGNQHFGSTVYSVSSPITYEIDIKDLSETMRMYYSTKHLRILAFSPMKASTSLERLRELFKQFAVEFFNGKRWRQKLKALSMEKK